MDCNATSSISNKSKAALTLVEMMVAIGVGSIVFAALGSLTLYSAKSFSSMVNYTDLNKESRMALDRMSKDIRQSKGLASRNGTNLTFFVTNPSGTNIAKLSYSYDPLRQTLIEKGPNGVKTNLVHCTFWTNEIFQRTPQPGMTFTNTTDVSECKMVEVRWSCNSGSSIAATNSQSVQSMKVVIRKKPD